MARKRTHKPSSPEKQALFKQRRAQLVELKSKGLISSKYDLRKITPRSGLLRKLANPDIQRVLAGTAQVATLPSRAQARRTAKIAGGTAVGKRYIPPEGTRVGKGKRKGLVEAVAQKGLGPEIKRTILPHEIETLEDFKKALAKMELEQGEKWAFRFKGGESSEQFDTLDELFAYLERYDVVRRFEGTDKFFAEVISNLELVRVDPSLPWVEIRNARHAQQARDKRRKHKGKLSPAAKEYKREYDRAYQKRRYEKLKTKMRKGRAK